jgi:DNA modification methylase
MFKATTAKYLYKKYNAKSVLDPTAGWGGRMLGAWALGIDYIGMDLNTEMSPAYDKMINKLRDTKDTKMDMIFGDCLLQDFSKFNYDMVLTSPPYINMEVYEHMPKWQSDEDYYLKFLIPLWDKCMTNMVSGHVCFNISPKMYEEAVKYGLPISHDEDLLKQQLGQKQNKKKQDKIYIWKK